MELYQGGVASRLELICAQIAQLAVGIESVQIKAERLKGSVALIRALDVGWNHNPLPDDEQIHPFNTFQYIDLDNPPPDGGMSTRAITG